MRWRKKKSATYSVIGLATDDGSTFYPAAILTGDVQPLLAGEDRPYPGSVLYVITDAPSPDVAAHRAVERFEAQALEGLTFWEQGEVYFI
jgi:hypothetical protein